MILNNIEYKQCSLAPRIWIASDGSYIIPNNKRDPYKVRYGTKCYNKQGYKLQIIICTSIEINVNGNTRKLSKVFNVGRLVLDAWKNEIDDKLEIDHIDRDPFNNNINNLRLVDRRTNLLNRLNYNPYWLHTKEVAKRRVQTKQIYKQFGKPSKETKHKQTQDLSIVNNAINLEERKQERAIERTKAKLIRDIKVYEAKLERWSAENVIYKKRVRRNLQSVLFVRYSKKLSELISELERLNNETHNDN